MEKTSKPKPSAPTSDVSASKPSASVSDASVSVEIVETESATVPADTAGRPLPTPSLPASCGANCGSLPAPCAPLAFPYVPMQDNNPVRYSRAEALRTGTLFPGLNLPFKEAIQERTKLDNTALAELMALDFAVQELGLYLTTHAQDQEALQLYWSYVQLSKEGREKYQAMYGPLTETDLTPEDGFAWLKDPWPWDLGGNQ